MSFWYLGTPYTNWPVTDGYLSRLDAAADFAAQQAAVLMKGGISVFSPIAHFHPIDRYLVIDPKEAHAYWMEANAPFMEASCGLLICTPKILQIVSVGIEHEINAFRSAGKPVWEMTPNTVPAL